MLNKEIFNPNERNIGGRKQINELVYNHHLSLLKVKPTLNTWNTKAPALKQLVSHKPKKLTEELEFKEVYHSFKKVVDMKKGYINNYEPHTMGLKKNLANKTQKNEKFIKSEHENHMISQRERIDRIQKPVERKKNEYDPVANPGYVIETQQRKKKVGSLDFMFNPTLNQRKVIKQGNLKLKK